MLDVAAAVAAQFPITRTRVSPLMSRTGRPIPGGSHRFTGTVRRLTSVEDLALAFPIMASAFHVDSNVVRTCYQGLPVDPRMSVRLAESRQPASVCISWRSGTTCYVYGMATAPDLQRQGVGRAALTAVMEEAVKEGGQTLLPDLKRRWRTFLPVHGLRHHRIHGMVEIQPASTHDTIANPLSASRNPLAGRWPAWAVQGALTARRGLKMWLTAL